MLQNLSGDFQEYKGSRQGHKRVAGNFIAYINPYLEAANSSNLGFNIHPHCVSAFCIVDVLNDDRRKLQNRIDIVGHYPRRYRLVFSVDKTKVTVTGSKHDVNYYKDVPIWSLNKEQIKVTETNEHLWLIVSGENAKFHQQFRFLEYKLQDGTKIRCVRSPDKTNSDGADH